MILFVFLLAQFAKDPLPPDLTYVSKTSCTLVQHDVADVLNSKTKMYEQVFMYRVEPYATYTDNRARWELPIEPVPNGRETRPGAIADVKDAHEALDKCKSWIDTVKKAITEEQKKRAHEVKPVNSTHRFYDRPTKWELVGVVALAAADTMNTCYHLAGPNWREDWLPTQSCGGVAAILAGQVAAQEVVAFVLHRMHAHKVERMTRLFSMEENTRGLVYSVRHTR